MKKILILLCLFSCMIAYGEEITIESTAPQIYSKEERITKKNTWGPYMKELEQTIKKNWNPPKVDASVKAKVIFVIAKDGSLLNYKITLSSKNEIFDQSALNAIEKTFPYKSLPEDFKGNSVPVEYTFDVNMLVNSTQSTVWSNNQEKCQTKFCKFIYEHQ